MSGKSWYSVSNSPARRGRRLCSRCENPDRRQGRASGLTAKRAGVHGDCGQRLESRHDRRVLWRLAALRFPATALTSACRRHARPRALSRRHAPGLLPQAFLMRQSPRRDSAGREASGSLRARPAAWRECDATALCLMALAIRNSRGIWRRLPLFSSPPTIAVGRGFRTNSADGRECGRLR